MKNSRSSSLKKFFWLFSFVFFVCLFLGAVWFCLEIRRSPFYSLSRENFVLVTGDRKVVVLSLQGKEGLIVRLPEKDLVKTTRGFGDYELGKVYFLGELEGKGGLLIKETVQENFSLPVFGYFFASGEIDSLPQDSKKIFSYIFWQSFRGRIKTDLSRLDLLVLCWRTRSLNQPLVKKDSLSKLDDSLFRDKKLRDESFSLAVFNSTDHFSLAQQAARVLTEAGARVVRVADTKEKQDDCLIIADPGLFKTYTFFWLRTVFGCQVRNSNAGDKRSDFSLVVGEEYWKKLNEKW
ncbi:MAG: LytR C-terminal domain-containing protein [Microgenomates group bacterium]